MRAAFDEGMKIKDQYEQLIATLMNQDVETRAKVFAVMQEVRRTSESDEAIDDVQQLDDK